MKIQITSVVSKSEDWKIVDGLADNVAFKDASVNRISKKGEVFPNFDAISPNTAIEAQMWQSPSGKWYVFPPKGLATQGGANKGLKSGFKAGIEKAMERKETGIKNFQDSKELSIKVSSTMRDAVIIAVEESKRSASAIYNFEEGILKWRKWLWEHFDAKDSDFSPFPDEPKYIPDEQI